MMPYDPTVNDHYGDVLWKLGNELEARFYWQKAIDLDQENIFEDKVKIKLLKGSKYVVEYHKILRKNKSFLKCSKQT